MLCATIATAAYRAPMAIDHSFGQDGFAVVPPYLPGYTVHSTLGFVTLREGDYIYFSVQTVGAMQQLVTTRFDADGHLVTNWGIGGSNVYTLPFYYDAGIRLKVQSAADLQEYIYIAGVSASGGDLAYAVGVIRAYDGANYSFSQSAPYGYPALPLLHAQYISGIYYSNGDMLFIGRGYNNAGGPGDVVDIFHAISDPPIIDKSTSAWKELTTPGLDVFEIGAEDHGAMPMAGHIGAQAAVIFYDTAIRGVVATNTFNLPCPVGAVPLWSAVDNATYYFIPAQTGYVVYGRSACSDGAETHTALMWMSTTPANVLTPVWTVLFDDKGSSCASQFACPSAYADLVRGGPPTNRTVYALATTTNGALERVDLGRDLASPRMVGTETNRDDFAIYPSQILGAFINSNTEATLVATAVRNGQQGLARIAIDRIFADVSH
ncbi:MAG TPA: hypothetical protein VF132_14870 [Rudaea sp.]